MIETAFQKVSASDISALVENAVRESRTVEYKDSLPSGRDEDKKEFLADVSSFANASGGDLLYGVTEVRDHNGRPTGIPGSADGLAGINVDQEIRRLESMIRDGVEPRMPGVQIRAIEGFSDGPVIMIRIPKSWASPHMVAFKASPRFFSRTSAGKAPLDAAEIRAAFVESEALPERVRQFRNERLGNILAGETPAPLSEGPLAVLHLLPATVRHANPQIDLMALLDGKVQLSPISASGWNQRLNIDGYVVSSGPGAVDQARTGYTQFFRNGTIEAVTQRILSVDQGAIPSTAFEPGVIRAVAGYFGIYEQLDIEGPVIAMLSLLNVRGFFLYVGPGEDAHAIDRQHLLLPEVVVEDLSAPAEKALRPLFDLVWQACGYRRSYNYDDHGNWKPRR